MLYTQSCSVYIITELSLFEWYCQMVALYISSYPTQRGCSTSLTSFLRPEFCPHPQACSTRGKNSSVPWQLGYGLLLCLIPTIFSPRIISKLSGLFLNWLPWFRTSIGLSFSPQLSPKQPSSLITTVLKKLYSSLHFPFPYLNFCLKLGCSCHNQLEMWFSTFPRNYYFCIHVYPILILAFYDRFHSILQALSWSIS